MKEDPLQPSQQHGIYEVELCIEILRSPIYAIPDGANGLLNDDQHL